MSRQTIDVLTVTIALVVAAAALSAFTGAGLASGSASTTTTIDSCTIIEELGTYTLDSDIETATGPSTRPLIERPPWPKTGSTTLPRTKSGPTR